MVAVGIGDALDAVGKTWRETMQASVNEHSQLVDINLTVSAIKLPAADHRYRMASTKGY